LSASSALGRRGVEPDPERRARRRHGGVDVGGRPAGDLGDDGAGRRVERLEALTAGAVDLLAADQDAYRAGYGGRHTGSIGTCGRIRALMQSENIRRPVSTAGCP
jgi:hypothetical protein